MLEFHKHYKLAKLQLLLFSFDYPPSTIKIHYFCWFYRS